MRVFRPLFCSIAYAVEYMVGVECIEAHFARREYRVGEYAVHRSARNLEHARGCVQVVPGARSAQARDAAVARNLVAFPAFDALIDIRFPAGAVAPFC